VKRLLYAEDPAIRKLIPVDNPARFYDFDDDLACSDGVNTGHTSAAD
jgi:hypothetical protein